MSANKKYSTADLNNGILESFDTKEEAKKALYELIEEGNKINSQYAEEYAECGLEVPDAADFYSVVEVVCDDDE